MESAPKALSPEKKKLLELEAMGKYVFHGSGEDIKDFELRQAVNGYTGEPEPVGPSIHATDNAEYAIFMAVISRKNIPGKKSGTEGGENGDLSYWVRRIDYEKLPDTAVGFVYVFDKDAFERRKDKRDEFVSSKVQTWIDVVPVRKRDLPNNMRLSDRE